MTLFVTSLQKIQQYQDLSDEITLLRITVPLSMFCLDCSDLNEDLAGRAKKLRDRLVKFCVDDNREQNRGCVCTVDSCRYQECVQSRASRGRVH